MCLFFLQPAAVNEYDWLVIFSCTMHIFNCLIGRQPFQEMFVAVLSTSSSFRYTGITPKLSSHVQSQLIGYDWSAIFDVFPSNWQLWRIDPSMAPLRPTYSHVSPAFPTWHPDDGCGLLPHIVWTFCPFVSQQSASGRFRFLVPPSGTTCLSTSHLRRQSRFLDNDSEPFCFPVPTKTLSHDSHITITIHHYCLDNCGPCNN